MSKSLFEIDVHPGMSLYITADTFTKAIKKTKPILKERGIKIIRGIRYAGELYD